MERVGAAMYFIEEAQNELDRACEALSSLEHFGDKHAALHKLRERVHAFWYTVKDTAERRENRIKLDSMAIAGCDERDAAREASK